MLGGGLGLLAGVAIGWLLYAGLLRIPVRAFFSVTAVLVLLLAAGMASQMAVFLQQADLIGTLGKPLWDSSAWLSERSTIGQLLHILIGYDAHPNPMQMLFYLSCLAAICLGMVLTRASPGKPLPAT